MVEGTSNWCDHWACNLHLFCYCESLRWLPRLLVTSSSTQAHTASCLRVSFWLNLMMDKNRKLGLDINAARCKTAASLLFPFRFVEWEFYNVCWRVLAVMLHRYLHSHIRPNFVIWLLQMCERNILLQQR